MRVSAEVVLSVSDLINSDLEDFEDALVAGRTGEYVMEITYELLGIVDLEQQMLRFKVTGDLVQEDPYEVAG